MSSSQSLIMGVAAGYSPKQLAPFLLSLRDTSYQGRIVMFVEGMDDASRAQVQSMGAEVVTLDGQYEDSLSNPFVRVGTSLSKWMKTTRGFRKHYPKPFAAVVSLPHKDKKKVWTDSERFVEGFQSLRYHHYLEFLKDQAQEADFVMICDTRDVIFQRDPFENWTGEGLIAVLEHKEMTIRKEIFNSRWVRNLYGSQGLEQIGDYVISCSGTVLGTREGMERYLRVMSEEVFQQRRPLGSHDQGIHNFLLRTGRLDPVSIQENLSAPVLTLGKDPDIKRDETGLLLNRDGTPVPVVHQYDRHEDLSSEIISKYTKIFEETKVSE